MAGRREHRDLDSGVCTPLRKRTPGPSQSLSQCWVRVQPLQLPPGNLASATTRHTRLQTSLNCSLTAPKALATQALARRDAAALPVAALQKGLDHGQQGHLPPPASTPGGGTVFLPPLLGD